MAKQKTELSSKEQQAALKRLRSQLRKAEEKADRWKKKARQWERAHAESVAQIKKLTRQRDKARRRASERPPAATAESAGPRAVDSTSPDSSWTVVQLRDEARARGLTGLSGKSKAQLLDTLS